MNQSRSMPNALNAERSILGGILLHQRALVSVAEHVAPEDFYHPAHQAIYRAMRDLDAAGAPIDTLSIAARMKADETIGKLRAVDGEAYFIKLTEDVVTVDNIAFHAQMVRGKATVRRLIEVAHEIVAQGYGEHGDVDQYLAEAEQRVLSITTSAARGTLVPLRKVVAETYAKLEQLAERAGGAPTGITSGFDEVDDRTGGFQPGELIVFAGRPGMGKTSLVLRTITRAAMKGVPCLAFSLEMSNESLAQRLLSAEGRVPLRHVRQAAMNVEEWKALFKARSRADGLPITLVDTDSINIAQLRSLARRWHHENVKPGQPAMVVLDYLQLLDSTMKEEFREREVAQQSRALKKLSRELACPVIALSQLNRGVDNRADQRPRLSDLRESGAIEQDADVVLFIYRDEVVNKASTDRGVAELIISKLRNGEPGTVRVGWDGATATLRPLDHAQGRFA